MSVLAGPLLSLLSGSLSLAWLVAVIAFLIIEAMVPGLISIWFAAGALAAMISSLFHVPVWMQLTLFVVVSAVTVAITRPLAARYVNSRTQATNADMLIGKQAVVCETVDNLRAAGAVKVNGQTWTARSLDDTILPEASTVIIERIEGVKLIVKAEK